MPGQLSTDTVLFNLILTYLSNCWYRVKNHLNPINYRICHITVILCVPLINIWGQAPCPVYLCVHQCSVQEAERQTLNKLSERWICNHLEVCSLRSCFLLSMFMNNPWYFICGSVYSYRCACILREVVGGTRVVAQKSSSSCLIYISLTTNEAKRILIRTSDN